MSALFAAYFLIPTRSGDDGSDLPWLILELGVFAVIVGIQVPAIVKAKYPSPARRRDPGDPGPAVPVDLRAGSTCRARSATRRRSPNPSTTSRALYFTVTVFASVGFGDIVAQTDSLRLLVTLQMVLNLVVFGVVIRLLASAARRGVARRGTQPTVDDTPTP